MPGQEQVSFEIDPRSVIGALKQMNDAILGYEKGGSAANEKLNDSFQRVSNLLLRVNDKQMDSMERLTRSIEKQAAAYGKTGVERLIAQRDAYIKRLGSEEEMVKRVTAAYDKMIAAESGGHGNNFREIGESVKNFIENPLHAAGGAASSFLERIGPIGGVIGGAAVTLTAFAAASFEAAKSLGEYGLQMKDLELRTGLGARQASEFSFAAKAVGQDVSVVERAMKGLTEAVVDNSAEGQKARDTLRAIGVSTRDLQGNIRPAGELLKDISTGLRAIPNDLQRIDAAKDIFKKVGIEALPFILELRENSEYFNSHGLPAPSQEAIEKFAGYNRQIAATEAFWDDIVRDVKQIPAAFWSMVTKPFIPNAYPTMGEQTAKDIAADREREQIEAAGGDIGMKRAAADLGRYLNRAGGIEGAQEELANLKRAYDGARTEAQRLVDAGSVLPDVAAKARREVENARISYERQLASVKELTRAEAARTSNLEEIRKLSEEQSLKQQYPYGLLPSQQKVLEFASRPDVTVAQVKQYGSILDPELAKERRDAFARAQSMGLESLRRELNLEDDSSSKPLSEIEARRKEATDREFLSGLERTDKNLSADFRIGELTLSADRQMRLSEAEAGIRIQGTLAGPDSGLRTDAALLTARKLALDDQYEHEKGLIDATAKYVNDADQRRTELRVKHAQEVGDLELQLAERVAQEQRKQFETIKSQAEPLIHTLFTKPSQFGKQLGETLRTDTLKPVTEGLSGMAASALRPLMYGADGQGGIAGMFKNMYGGDRQDPVKMSTDQNTLATMHNSLALQSLTAALATTPAFAGAGAPSYSQSGSFGGGYSYSNSGAGTGSGGFSWPSIGTGGGINLGSFAPLGGMLGGGNSWDGFGGGASTPISGGTRSGASAGGFNLGGIFGRGSLFGAPGGTAPFAPFPSGGGSSDGWSTSNVYNPATGSFDLAGTRAGSSSSFHPPGISSLFGGNLKDKWFNENINTGSGTAQAASSMGIGGDFAGVLTSQGAASLYTGVGVPLAEAGLTGTRRGTWGGVGESTLGGALTGAGIGTMILPGIGTAIGAGIGAFAGFAASTLEMAAGVESPENKAKRLVKQIYNINIDLKMAQQIVQMANQKYGGNVTAAVRDPDLRKELEVYAAGTGQYKNFPASATTPHAGSLVEQNGQLFQQATYNMGYASTFQSNLPVLGGIAGSTTPNPGGPINLSLNVNGQAASDLLAGQVVNTATPDFVSAQANAAMAQSMNRTSTAATLQNPGLVV